MLVAYAIAAICLSAPVGGPIVAGYAPAGDYAGHWGVDYSAPVGVEVRAPASGVVTFGGSVAGMQTVTIEPVPGFKVSVSYLSQLLVSKGQRVRRGEMVGRAGSPHGSAGVHMSTRIDGEYVDPRALLGCFDTDISRALRLLTPRQEPPRRRLSTIIDKKVAVREVHTRGASRAMSAMTGSGVDPIRLRKSLLARRAS